MFDIIDFIFDNIFFILLIGGAILNFLGRNKQEDSKKKKTTTPKPVQEIDWKQIFEQEAKPIEPKRVEPVEPVLEPIIIEEVEQSPIEEERNKLLEKQAELKMLEDKLKTVPQSPIMTIETTKKKTGQSYFHKLTKDEVVRGVIWSEVLGKPRAKRPLEKIYRK